MQFPAELEVYIEDGRLDMALEKCTNMLEANNDCTLLLAQSILYHRLGKHQKALDAADKCVELANKENKPDIVGEGQLRRGISLLSLKRYDDSKYCLDLASKYNPGDKSIPVWLRKVADKISTPGPIYVQKIPKTIPEKSTDASTSKKESATAAPTKAPRYDWYQTTTSVNLSVFQKSAPKDGVRVEYPDNTTLRIAYPGFEFHLSPLKEAINPKESSFTVFGTKIELKLEKLEKKNWATLLNETEAHTTDPFKKGTTLNKDWDSLAAQELNKLREHKVGDEEDEDTALEDTSDPESFFRKIYANADEETKRAMMKSYVESNGTALSTNWNEVSKAKVPISPPDGAEPKHWT